MRCLPACETPEASGLAGGEGAGSYCGSGNPVSYYLHEGLGSVANVTDASGNVDVSYTYDAFGAIRTQSSAHDNYWGFAGEQRDDELGPHVPARPLLRPGDGVLPQVRPGVVDHGAGN